MAGPSFRSTDAFAQGLQVRREVLGDAQSLDEIGA